MKTNDKILSLAHTISNDADNLASYIGLKLKECNLCVSVSDMLSDDYFFNNVYIYTSDCIMEEVTYVFYDKELELAVVQSEGGNVIPIFRLPISDIIDIAYLVLDYENYQKELNDE